jgi:hypothetical protein
MELENYEKAKEIKKELDEVLRLNGFCNNSSTHITLEKLDSSNNWESIRLPKLVKEGTICYIKNIINARIEELEQQFKEL